MQKSIKVFWIQIPKTVAKLELSNEWIFQYNNYTKHTEKSIKKWIAEHWIIEMAKPVSRPQPNREFVALLEDSDTFHNSAKH